jgi:hypothetical protein
MKYKILGYSLVCFIIFMVSLWLWPKDEINSSLFVDTNIDSILVDKAKNHFTITSGKDIKAISNQLKSAEKIDHVKCERCSTAFYDLNVYMKKKSKPIFLRISFTEYDGVLLRAGDLDYRGRSLDSLIRTFEGS